MCTHRTFFLVLEKPVSVSDINKNLTKKTHNAITKIILSSSLSLFGLVEAPCLTLVMMFYLLHD
jgi:hypothetical protein